jgi:hypothetical protein
MGTPISAEELVSTFQTSGIKKIENQRALLLAVDYLSIG